MLQLVNVHKKYKEKHAVNGISFALEKGDSLGLIGTNGAGKSTTISMIATLIQPDSGDILYHDQSIIKNPNIIRKRLGYVPQEIALYENLSGLDNLKFWGRAYHLKGKELENAIERVQKVIGFTSDELKQKVATYSGGMKRRVNIGVALLHDPEIVIMDEPTVGIDFVSRNLILSTIKEINKRGVTIIYTGHYLEEIEQICNKICIMDSGSIIAMGNKQDLLQKLSGDKKLEQLYLRTISN
ncbi:ABC transporter, ATP-binding protein [Lachnospiraceae bacterium KM106-2]|nr:ABC transporter, ATP-binding protein [Lachnospiraceae bacterium KM106-2]